ncbi:MAG TPA: DUF2934 domain-containing protein [Verrucomicrobiae bacterium]|jgi:hypothetical protein|nr:DUF2934 domain-containing protein [Verrucomicrobiae bacterium]
MAKSKFPKFSDNNEVIAKTAQPDAPESLNGEASASFAKSASTTKAESTKAKPTRNRGKSGAESSGVSSGAKLEAVQPEHRGNGETRMEGNGQGKIEARGNVVPINLEDEIRRLAYLLSERRGFEPGHEREDWLAAEREVLQRYRQQSA